LPHVVIGVTLKMSWDLTTHDVASERIGHKNVSMTLEIYAHVLPDMQEDAAATLGAPASATGDNRTTRVRGNFFRHDPWAYA
jgi:hypothetical protein